jgi:DNA polymerase III subunit delta
MVLIKSSFADAHVASAGKLATAVLVYGQDPGLVSERAQKAAKTLEAATTPPGEIVRLSDSDLESDPDRLATELGTMPMFGGRRIVRIEASRKVNAALVGALIDGSALEGCLVLEAGALKKDDALLALFEKSTTAQAIQCYGDEARDLGGLVDEIVKANGMTIAGDARAALIERLGADRGLSRAEVDKLCLYAHGATVITLDDVRAAVGDAADLAVDGLLKAALEGDPATTGRELDRLLASGESPQGIMAIALRHIQRLHRVRTLMDQGRGLEDALRMLRPPVIYTQKALFTQQVNQWPSAALTRALEAITDGQRRSRGGAMPDDVLVDRLVFDLARLGATVRQSRARR